MRIGIDFDGTLADTGWAKQQYISETWGIHLEPWETMRTPAFEVLGEERYHEMVLAAHTTELVLRMPEIPGAIAAVARLAEQHDLFVITARRDEEIELARQWLADHRVPITQVIHTRWESKRASWETHGIDVHIDDLPSVLLDHPEAMTPVLLHSRYNEPLDHCERTVVVPDWPGFEELVRGLATVSEGARAADHMLR